MSHTIEKHLLLSYVKLLAERHSYAPDEGFEFQLWRDMSDRTYRFMSSEECDDLVYLVETTQCWVTFNLQSQQLELIDLPAWDRVREP